MKKLISILGITTIGLNSLVLPIQNINNKEESIKSNLKINNEQNKIDIAEQWYLKIANTKQETLFKDNLLSSISLKDDHINFDLNKINKILWNDNNIYNLISSPGYIKNLQLMYNFGNLQFINDKPQFVEKPDYYNYSGVWVESHWYWFGYWKLHIGHIECQRFLDAIRGDLSTVINIVTFVIRKISPMVGAVASAVALLLFTNALIIKYNDKGNGIWLGFYALIPNMGWGSD